MEKHKWASDIMSVIQRESVYYLRVPPTAIVHMLIERIEPQDINFFQRLPAYFGSTIRDFIEEMHETD